MCVWRRVQDLGSMVKGRACRRCHDQNGALSFVTFLFVDRRCRGGVLFRERLMVKHRSLMVKYRNVVRLRSFDYLALRLLPAAPARELRRVQNLTGMRKLMGVQKLIIF